MGSVRYFEVSLEDVKRRLIEFLQEEPYDLDILIIFGSVLRRPRVRDIDLAIHSKRGIELNDLLRLKARLERRLELPVDPLPLGQAPPKVRLKILREGLPLLVRSWSLYAELLKVAAGESMDLELKRTHGKPKWAPREGCGSPDPANGLNSGSKRGGVL